MQHEIVTLLRDDAGNRGVGRQRRRPGFEEGTAQGRGHKVHVLGSEPTLTRLRYGPGGVAEEGQGNQIRNGELPHEMGHHRIR